MKATVGQAAVHTHTHTHSLADRAESAHCAGSLIASEREQFAGAHGQHKQRRQPTSVCVCLRPAKFTARTLRHTHTCAATSALQLSIGQPRSELRPQQQQQWTTGPHGKSRWPSRLLAAATLRQLNQLIKLRPKLQLDVRSSRIISRSAGSRCDFYFLPSLSSSHQVGRATQCGSGELAQSNCFARSLSRFLLLLLVPKLDQTLANPTDSPLLLLLQQQQQLACNAI